MNIDNPDNLAARERQLLEGKARLVEQITIAEMRLQSPDLAVYETEASLQDVYRAVMTHADFVESLVAQDDLSGASNNERWRRHRAEISFNLLETFPNIWAMIRSYCQHLEIPLSRFQPSRYAFAGLQRIVSEMVSSDAADLRRRFEAEGLPTKGFDYVHAPVVGSADSGAATGPAENKRGAPLSWLHLSDLHVGCRGDAAWWHVMDQFWRSVDHYSKIVGTPDLVLLTGDLTYKGERAEFDGLTKFVEKLIARLPRNADGNPPLLVAVPGNHDLQRPRGRDALLYRVLRDYEIGRDDPDVAALLDEFWGEKPDASFLQPLFAQYLAWFDEIIRPQAVRPGVKLHTSFFPGDIYVSVDLPGHFPLSIVGLNSAWLQYQGGDFEGKLALPVEQFHMALPHAKGTSPLGILEESHRALLLMHHPPSWLSKAQQQLFDSGIYQGERFVACLHGHMHEPGAVNASRAGGVTRCYYQAPSLFGVEHYGSKNESRSFGYTWATLRDDGELRAWPLKLGRKGDGSEAFDRDDYFHWDYSSGNVLLRPADGRRHVGKPSLLSSI